MKHDEQCERDEFESGLCNCETRAFSGTVNSLVSLQDFQNWLDAMPKGGTPKHVASCICVLLKQLDCESLRDVTNRSLCAEREQANAQAHSRRAETLNEKAGAVGVE